MVDVLILVRHGDAEPFGLDGDDASRRLTEAGIAALGHGYPEIFTRLRGRDKVSLWVSPAVRALQTAEVIAGIMGVSSETFETHESLYEQDDDAFLSELDARGEGCVIAVGHIPCVQRLLFELTGCDVPFGKGAVAAISFSQGKIGRGRLEWFVQGPR